MCLTSFKMTYTLPSPITDMSHITATRNLCMQIICNTLYNYNITTNAHNAIWYNECNLFFLEEPGTMNVIYSSRKNLSQPIPYRWNKILISVACMHVSIGRNAKVFVSLVNRFERSQLPHIRIYGSATSDMHYRKFLRVAFPADCFGILLAVHKCLGGLQMVSHD